jgi:hypothetical protein
MKRFTDALSSGGNYRNMNEWLNENCLCAQLIKHHAMENYGGVEV